jgi:DeoR/GlpR family transcriptional regulator of sugar metabolism
MIEQSKQTVIVADSTKIGVVTPALICPISNIHMLITDQRASDKAIAPFVQRGIDVRRV